VDSGALQHGNRNGVLEKTGVTMKNRTNIFYCLTCLIGLALLSTAQTRYDGRIEAYPVHSFAVNDFWAVSNSVYKAATTNWMKDGKAVHLQETDFEQIRFLFGLMGSITTSKVEVICYRHSGMDLSEGALSFWITDNAIYRIRNPVFLWDKYALSLAKTVRTKTFDTELNVFDSVPLTKSTLNTLDVPFGFYVRRILDETFESVYFPIIVEDTPAEKIQMMYDKAYSGTGIPLEQLRDNINVPKISAFNHLLKTFDELMEKPVVWSNDGTPRTRTE